MSIQLQCDTKSGEQPIFKSDDGRCLAVDEKPTCVWLPGYLGGDRVTVLDTFMIKNCRCGTHPAKVQIFEGKYMVMECLKDGLLWIEKPKDIETFKKKDGYSLSLFLQCLENRIILNRTSS